MKILKKDQLIKKNLLIKTQAERDILEKIKNPYIVGLHYAFQTEGKLYFLIDFLNGGELFTYLRKEQKFNEYRAKLYAAEMICAIEALH
jgi:serine/threonine protein kinase